MAYIFKRKTGWVLIDKSQKRWVKLGQISSSQAKQILRRYETEATYLRLDIPIADELLTMQELCDLYVDDLKRSPKGAYTVDREEKLLKHFCKTFGERKVYTIGAEDLERYLKEKGYKAYSAHNVIKSLRGAFKLGCLRKIVERNIALEVRLPKIEKLPPRAPDPKLVEKVLSKMTGRIRAFYEILRFTGMRPGEAIQLQARDVTPEAILVRAPKTKDFRAVPIHPKLKKFLRPLTSGISGEDYLFPGIPGEHQKSMKMGLRRAQKGMKVKISAYSLRHFFATEVLRNSNLRAVQTLLGHSRSTTTERYAHALGEDLKKAVRSL